MPYGVLRVRPVSCVAAPKEISQSGRGLIVLGGAPGVRILFDKSEEQFPGENSVEALTGLCVAHDFKRLWIKAESAVEMPDVVIQVLECAPCHEVNLGGARILFRRQWDAQEFQAVDLEEDEPFVALLIAAQEGWLAKRADNRVGFFDAWFLGGALTCDKAFELRLWAKISSTQRALVARLEVDVEDPDGAFSASLETGWKPTHHGFGTNTQNHRHGALLPLSMPWELEIVQPDGENLTVAGVAYAYALN